CSRPSQAGWTTSGSGDATCRRGPMSPPSGSRAPNSRSRSGCCSGASASPSFPPSGSKAPAQRKPVGVLSGGERNRLNLALPLREGGNLLLLAEPTNDLDVATLRWRERALRDVTG